VLALCIDDYAEIWVNGELRVPLAAPARGRSRVLNMPQRLVLSDAVSPGDTFQIAVFASTGLFGKPQPIPCGFVRHGWSSFSPLWKHLSQQTGGEFSGVETLLTLIFWL